MKGYSKHPPARLLFLAGMASALLGAAFAAGCVEAWVVLPDSASSTAAFSPDGRSVVVARYGSEASIYAYDLEERRVLWRRESQPEIGMTFSASGSYVLLAEQKRRGAESAHISVIRSLDGVPIFELDFPYGNSLNRTGYAVEAARRFSPSDDGRWLLAAPTAGGVELYAVAKAEPVLRSDAGSVLQVSFSPDSRRAAVFMPDGRLQILELAGGSWREAVLLRNAAWPHWVPAGVAFVSEEAVEVWDGRARRTLASLGDHLHDTGTRYRGPAAYVSRDGRHAVVQTRTRFELFDLETGERRLTHSVTSERPALVCDAAFGAARLYAFLCTGQLIEVDLGAARVVEERSFGDPGRYSKSFGHEGATQETRYEPSLSPSGRFLDIYRRTEGHEIYRLE